MPSSAPRHTPYKTTTSLRLTDVPVDRNATENHSFYCLSPWRKLRASVLREQPLCVECLKQGITVAAQMVDHIVPIKKNDALKLERSNLMPLCNHCHAIKRAKDK